MQDKESNLGVKVDLTRLPVFYINKPRIIEEEKANLLFVPQCENCIVFDWLQN